ncbi:MAG: hypothetical protein Q8N18_01310 [Opitutaceae bacterium]|nr:hypothetical protein [Opitutaceae bacterium]
MSTAKPSSSRLDYLDLTKGLLVCVMVIYHSLNYTNQYHLGFRFFSFLPPSFVLITGFLLAVVYFPRFQRGEPGLAWRLVFRSLRLLTLFVGLNVIAQWVRSPAYGQKVGVAEFFAHWQEVFLQGGARLDGGARIAAFEVLLPIAYTIALAPLLLMLAAKVRWFLPVFCGAFVGLCGWLGYYDYPFINLLFMGAGVIGIFGGWLVRDPDTLERFFWPALAAAVAYAVLGTGRGYVYALQMAGSIIAVVFLCGLSMKLANRFAGAWLIRHAIRVGQYSLVAYVGQIALLQILVRPLGRPDPVSWGALAMFGGTLVGMSLLVETTKWLRGRSALADRAYKLVFA